MGARDESECLLAIDASIGEELWVTKIGSLFREAHGNGPRGTPAVEGNHLYALSGRGNLVCANVADGKILWQQSMTALGGTIPHWGYTESVLVDGDQVVCTPGGEKGALAAFEKITGTPRWQSAQFTDPAHYSSIVAADINATRQYVQITERSVVGLAAKDGTATT